MKRIKKIASLILAMAMIFAMSATVLAANGATPPVDSTPEGNTPVYNEDGNLNSNFTITIKDTTEGYTYNAYQIFTGDLNKLADGSKTLSNIKWGSGVDVSKAEAIFKTADGKPMTAAQVAASLDPGTGKNEFDTTTEGETLGAVEFAEMIAKCLTGVSAESAYVPAVMDGDTVKTPAYYTIGSLVPGYYLVQNSKVPGVDGDFTRYMMEVVGDVEATPKRGTLEHEKQIVVPNGTEGVDFVKVNEAPIGGTVNYRIPVTLPQNFADYKEYYLEFSDTLTKGLTFNPETVKIEAGDTDITKYFYVEPKTVEGTPTEDTLITISISDLKGLNKIEGITIDATTPIVLTYSATLNENAVVGIKGNPNFVKVVHSNDPNHSGDGTTTPPENPDKPTPSHPTGVTPEKDVVTYTTELAILKTNEKNEVLPGTQFTLSGEGVLISYVTEETFVEPEEGEDGFYWELKNGSYTLTPPVIADNETDNTNDYVDINKKYVLKRTITPVNEANATITAEVREDGRVIFTGLGQGTYTLHEEVTLPGYNTIDDIVFTISFDPESKTFSTDNPDISVGANNTLQMGIVNKSGSLLPSTGGIGTTIFYVVGGVLVAGAGILLVTKKRMSAR